MKRQLFSRWSRGLMSAVFLSLFVLAAAVFVGCDQQSPVSVTPQADSAPQEGLARENSPQLEQCDALEAITFSYEGKLLNQAELAKQLKGVQPAVMVALVGATEQNLVRVFRDEREYLDWAKNSAFAGQLADLNLRVLEARQSKRNSAPNSTLGAGGWGTLYDGSSCVTALITAYATSIVSSLGTKDNKATSVKTYNPSSSFATVCSLYSGTSFQGSQYIIINQGAGLIWCHNLPSTFNNITSSFIVL